MPNFAQFNGSEIIISYIETTIISLHVKSLVSPYKLQIINIYSSNIQKFKISKRRHEKVLTEVVETNLEAGKLCVMNLVKEDHSFSAGREATSSDDTPVAGELSISSKWAPEVVALSSDALSGSSYLTISSLAILFP